MVLTDIQCKKAKPQEKAYRLVDGGGLYLWVTPKGSKMWRLRYYFPKGGKEKTLVIGSYPEYTLQEARDERSKAKKLLNENIDPMDVKKRELNELKDSLALTFKSVAMQWYEFNKDTWAEKTQKQILKRLEADIFPSIGNTPIKQLKRMDIIEAIRSTAENRGVYETGRRLAGYCRDICSYAVHEEIIDANPAVELSKSLKKKKVKHHASIESSEIPELLIALEYKNRQLTKVTIDSIWLIMLTFVRTKELIGATWDEFDFDNAQWTIKAERMKMKQPHIVPLSEKALRVFKDQYELTGHRIHVFPNRNNPQKHMSNGTINNGLKKLGFKGRHTGHGFRALALSTIQEKLKYRFEVVDRQLAHVAENKIRAAYDRAQFLDERTQMMQDWDDYLENIRKSILIENK